MMIYYLLFIILYASEYPPTATALSLRGRRGFIVSPMQNFDRISVWSRERNPIVVFSRVSNKAHSRQNADKVSL